MSDPQVKADRIFQRLDTVTKYPYARREYARRIWWGLLRHGLFRWVPGRVPHIRPALLRLCGATLARTVNIRPSVRIRHPWLLTVGEHSAIGDHVEVYNLGQITIGDHTVISQNTHLCAGTHDHTKPDLPLIRATITIGSGVWICADAFIGPNVTIGANALIAARAVVTKDVPANVIVAGNPARVIGQRPMMDSGADADVVTDQPSHESATSAPMATTPTPTEAQAGPRR